MRNAALDVDYLASRGVRVCGTGIPGYGSTDKLGSGERDQAPPPPGLPSTIEVAWALIFALFKRVTYEDRAIRDGIWQQGMPSILAGATLGLVGLGRLGAQMIAPARAFGMEVIAWSQNLTRRARGRGGRSPCQQGGADGRLGRRLDPSGAERSHAQPGRRGRSSSR